MKNVKTLSLGIAMLICFVSYAQDKSVSENNSLQTKIKANSFTKSKDTISNVKVSSNFLQPATSPTRLVICAPSRSLLNEPLYILDGDVINAKQFSKVNPNDIQKINILKEAAAVALYGSKAKNGVIIITLKEED